MQGVIWTVQQALPLLSANASIILTSSIGGLVGMAGAAVYGASKAAVRSLSRTMAAELKARGIRVNTITPGHVPTEGWASLGMPTEGPGYEQLRQAITPHIPLGRLGEVNELAAAVLFLASSDSSYVNGVDLVVDGGKTQL
jgi:NAD(P)-dependent dehydrogenase (short-subunit alcohol dehydrogenase family)